MLIWVRSFRPVCYYVYTFTGLDEYERITFYDKSVKLEEKFQIGENVFLHINPENLGQFFVENAAEPDKRIIFEISAMILMGLIIIQYLLYIAHSRISSAK